MFSNSIGQIDAASTSGSGDGTVEMMAMFGTCSRALLHNAPVSLAVKLPQNSFDEQAILTVCNFPSENNNLNGYALKVPCGRAILKGDVEFTDNCDLPAVKWAKATSIWTNASGNGSYVDCDKVADKDGATSSGTIRVYLPRFGVDATATIKNASDPNVQIGDVIQYVLDMSGVAFCTSGYLDSVLGTIKMWALSTTPPAGWMEWGPAAGRIPGGYKEFDDFFDPLLGNPGSELHFHTGRTDMSGSGVSPIVGDTGSKSPLQVDGEIGLVANSVAATLSVGCSFVDVISTSTDGAHTHDYNIGACAQVQDNHVANGFFLDCDVSFTVDSFGDHHHTFPCNDIGSGNDFVSCVTYDTQSVADAINAGSVHNHTTTSPHSHSIDSLASFSSHFHKIKTSLSINGPSHIVVAFIQRVS